MKWWCKVRLWGGGGGGEGEKDGVELGEVIFEDRGMPLAANFTLGG